MSGAYSTYWELDLSESIISHSTWEYLNTTVKLSRFFPPSQITACWNWKTRKGVCRIVDERRKKNFPYMEEQLLYMVTIFVIIRVIMSFTVLPPSEWAGAALPAIPFDASSSFKFMLSWQCFLRAIPIICSGIDASGSSGWIFSVFSSRRILLNQMLHIKFLNCLQSLATVFVHTSIDPSTTSHGRMMVLLISLLRSQAVWSKPAHLHKKYPSNNSRNSR